MDWSPRERSQVRNGCSLVYRKPSTDAISFHRLRRTWAAGWDYNLAGPVISELVRLPVKNFTITEQGIRGELIGLNDPYGSLICDIPAEEFKKLGYNIGEEITVLINNKPMTAPYMKTFMDVPVGDTLLYIDSRGRMGLAVNQGNYSEKFNVRPPGTIFIPRKASR